MTEEHVKDQHGSALARIGSYMLFWGWNVVFLAFMLLGFAPLLLPDLIRAARLRQIPAAFLAYGVVLIAVPVVAVILGATLLRRSPRRLFALGYGVEGPLMLLLTVRFFLLREATPAVTLLLTVAGLGMAAYLWQILDRRIDARGPALTFLRAAGLTLLLLAGLYAAAWMAFYVIPLPIGIVNLLGEALRGAGQFLSAVWSALIRGNWTDLLRQPWAVVPFSLLGIILLVLSATLFLAMPLVVPVLYALAWRRGVVRLAASYGRVAAAGVTAGVTVLCAVLFGLSNQQPQAQAFALLAQPPASPQAAQALRREEPVLRAGLLNAYLAPFRYLSAVGEVTHVSDMYERSLRLPAGRAAGVQRLYESVALPVLYRPVHERPADPARRQPNNWALQEEPREAARLYRSYFDEDIVSGERAAVAAAVRSTWSAGQAEAAWQAVDEHEVHLDRQELAVAEHGDWADMQLHEVYRNQTGQRQEVVYYFSLPESAVITGVWLGDSADKSKAAAYRVAPRGAAQAVYRNEVRYNRDPALVEQIGPRQYRLRVFPIEPKRWTDGADASVAGPEVHLWLSWRVLAQGAAWPLPRLAEWRNLFWDDGTVRLANDAPLQSPGDQWLPDALPATAQVKPVAHRVDFADGQSVLVHPSGEQLSLAPVGKMRLAVVLDRSRSMAGQVAAVRAALAQLAPLSGPTGSDVYLTASPYQGAGPQVVPLADFDPATVMYAGGQNNAELLAQFKALRANREYDAILVLTDGTGYELGGQPQALPSTPAPLWLIHLNGEYPLGYDDATLQVIQASGGGTTSSVATALARLAVRQQAQGDLVDGYAWRVLPRQAAGQLEAGTTLHAEDDGFAALAARQVILAAMREKRALLNQPAALDSLHALAKAQSIVTPYSSMIVLVNDGQQQALNRLEGAADRFDREGEAAGETVPTGLNVAGVPEPQEWLLLALAVGLLAWYALRSGQGQWLQRLPWLRRHP